MTHVLGCQPRRPPWHRFDPHHPRHDKVTGQRLRLVHAGRPESWCTHGTRRCSAPSSRRPSRRHARHRDCHSSSLWPLLPPLFAVGRWAVGTGAGRLRASGDFCPRRLAWHGLSGRRSCGNCDLHPFSNRERTWRPQRGHRSPRWRMGEGGHRGALRPWRGRGTGGVAEESRCLPPARRHPSLADTPPPSAIRRCRRVFRRRRRRRSRRHTHGSRSRAGPLRPYRAAVPPAAAAPATMAAPCRGSHSDRTRRRRLWRPRRRRRRRRCCKGVTVGAARRRRPQRLRRQRRRRRDAAAAAAATAAAARRNGSNTRYLLFCARWP